MQSMRKWDFLHRALYCVYEHELFVGVNVWFIMEIEINSLVNVLAYIIQIVHFKQINRVKFVWFFRPIVFVNLDLKRSLETDLRLENQRSWFVGLAVEIKLIVYIQWILFVAYKFTGCKHWVRNSTVNPISNTTVLPN